MTFDKLRIAILYLKSKEVIKIKLSKNVYMIHSEFFDFVASLYRINNNEKLIQSIKSKIPESRNQEIKIFFNYETFYGMCLVHEFMDCDNITIEEALNTLEGISPLRILESFISAAILESFMNVPKINKSSISSINFREDIKEGFLLYIIVGGAIINFFAAPLSLFIPIFSKGLSKNQSNHSWLIS